MTWDAIERQQLCDLFVELGSDAATVLEGWTTLDLAAHLVLRERELTAAPGLVVPGPWGRFAERRRLALKDRPFDELVTTVRSGPPPGLFRLGWVRSFANLNEFFVHHEDVRRANGLEPRVLPSDEDAALFRNVSRGGRILARRLRGAGLELSWAGTDRVVTVKRSTPVARVDGSPGELLLFLFGRAEARVDVNGPPDAVAAVKGTSFGM